MRPNWCKILILIGLLSLGGCHVRWSSAPTPPPIQYITATPLPTFALPSSFIESLTATPPVFETPTPELGLRFSPLFVSATPSFSLPTSQIVYVCYMDGSDEICLMNADGSNIRRLTNQAGTDWYPSFSPDGQTIVFSSQHGNGDFNIYSMDSNGQNLRQLTRGMGDNFAPAFSPDGARIVFTSTFGGEGEQNIWVMNADGSNPTRLTNTSYDDIDPEWSPDGRQISFASNRAGLTDLFVMDADGSNVRRLTFGFNIGGRNDWSADGLYFTFYAGGQADKNIFVLEATCASQTGACLAEPLQLTNGGNNKGPTFSPNGQWIAYVSNRDGDNEIFIMRIDGTDVRQLTFNNYPDWQPRWGP